MKLINDDILDVCQKMKQLNTSNPAQYSQFSEYIKQIKRDNKKILGQIAQAYKLKGEKDEIRENCMGFSIQQENGVSY